MNKEELRELAEWGARRKVADMERTLDTLQREFPHIFINAQRPLLLKAELREGTSNGNGHIQKSMAARAAWTPERRAEQGERMRKRIKKQGGIRKKARKFSTASGKKWGDKWYEQLQKANGSERIKDSAAALGTEASSLISSSERYLKTGVIKRVEPGVYAIGKTKPDQAAQQ